MYTKGQNWSRKDENDIVQTERITQRSLKRIIITNASLSSQKHKFSTNQGHYCIDNLIPLMQNSN